VFLEEATIEMPRQLLAALGKNRRCRANGGHGLCVQHKHSCLYGIFDTDYNRHPTYRFKTVKRSRMQLTLHTDYSLRLLIYLATYPDTPASVREIADAYGISSNHLAKVAQTLAQ